MLTIERRLVADLSGATDPARQQAVLGWVARALDDMPDGLRLGVKAESAALAAWAAVARPADLGALLGRLETSPIGVIRSYPRLFRSLVLFAQLELEPEPR